MAAWAGAPNRLSGGPLRSTYAGDLLVCQRCRRCDGSHPGHLGAADVGRDGASLHQSSQNNANRQERDVTGDAAVGIQLNA